MLFTYLISYILLTNKKKIYKLLFAHNDTKLFSITFIQIIELRNDIQVMIVKFENLIYFTRFCRIYQIYKKYNN